MRNAKSRFYCLAPPGGAMGPKRAPFGPGAPPAPRRTAWVLPKRGGPWIPLAAPLVGHMGKATPVRTVVAGKRGGNVVSCCLVPLMSRAAPLPSLRPRPRPWPSPRAPRRAASGAFPGTGRGWRRQSWPGRLGPESPVGQSPGGGGMQVRVRESCSNRGWGARQLHLVGVAMNHEHWHRHLVEPRGQGSSMRR